MKPTIRDSHASVAMPEIKECLERIGVQAPDDYERFLETTNGGVYHEPAAVNGYVIKEFFGIDTGLPWNDLDLTFRRKPEIYKEFMPIALAEGCEYLAIGIDDQFVGRVFSLNSDIPDMLLDLVDDGSLPNLYANELTSSFEEMLTEIEIIEDDVTDVTGWDRWVALDDRDAFRQELQEMEIVQILNEQPSIIRNIA